MPTKCLLESSAKASDSLVGEYCHLKRTRGDAGVK
jgi:hypothetical protein